MEDIDFSDDFCRFIQSLLPSVESAESLLALYRANDEALERSKQGFRAAGFSDQEIARHLATLAQAYEERPVTLFRLVYALRDHKIRSFADAFKLRKD